MVPAAEVIVLADCDDWTSYDAAPALEQLVNAEEPYEWCLLVTSWSSLILMTDVPA
jgi:hypothetical protein